MITCNELRIGNYVVINENPERVSVISRSSVFTTDADEAGDQGASEHSLDQVQPVPLTDEVLKQCGFVYHDYFKFWQLITTGIRSEMNISTDFEVIDFMRKPLAKKLDSLHQLQNIYFMLKGRELNFNKTAVASEQLAQ